jgi:hypothetical protein
MKYNVSLQMHKRTNATIASKNAAKHLIMNNAGSMHNISKQLKIGAFTKIIPQVK